MSKKVFQKNLLLIMIVAIICIVPILIVNSSEFGGADGQAKEVITEINADYEPWFDNIWTPPGQETENLLFALQAAIGSGVIFYILGYLKGQRETEKEGSSNESKSKMRIV